MHSTHFLQDLATVMVVAAATTLLCRWLKQPVVIGYLLAGLIIGPYTPPFSLVYNLESIHTMAELGLVFLMFYLGLEFNLPKLRKVGVSATLAAVLEVISMFGLGYLLGNLFGWSRMDSIFLGAILSISSTTIIVKVFMDMKMTHQDFAQAVFGILILEDIVAILILSVLSGLSTTGSVELSLIAIATLKIILFIILFLILGLSLVPRFISRIGRFDSKEMTGIVILGLCLSGALLASWFGFSVALGSFLMGTVVAASHEIERVEDWFQPIRDMFSAIFFVSAGMLIQPHLLWEYKGAILAVVIVTLIGKILSGTLGSILAGFRIKTSARIGFSLAQIGEFSFVIASLGVSSKVASEFLYPMAVTVSSLTTFCTPYLIRHSDSIVDGLLKFMPSSVTKALDRYHSRMAHAKDGGKNLPETLIISKYLFRLVIYTTLLITIIFAAQSVNAHFAAGVGQPRPFLKILSWTFAGILSLPFFTLICKYASHMILLLATISPHSPVLKYFNIHIFYNAVQTILYTLIAVLFLAFAISDFPSVAHLSGLALLMLSVSLFVRKPLAIVMEWIEEVLDEVLGLATSEPTRQAVLASAGRESIFEEITRQAAVRENSKAANQTIRDLRIRELTGASVVAIYRKGKHIANPSPNTELLPEDIIILLGEEKDCEKAQALLES